MVNQRSSQSVKQGGYVQREPIEGRADSRFLEASACLRDIFAKPDVQRVTSDRVNTHNAPGPHFSKCNFELYPGYAQLRRAVPPKAQMGGGIRGKITEFSKKSRVRLFKLLNALTLPLLGWQTFTFADDVLADKDITQRAKFAATTIHRLRYHAEKAGVFGVWRREWEHRKSGPLKGELMPHFHFMYTRKGLTQRRFASLATHLAKKWVKLTGTQDTRALPVATHKRSYEWLSTHRKAIAYVSKYVAKREEMPDSVSLGRAWGRIGVLPVAEGFEIEMNQVTYKHLKRMLRRWLPKKSRKRMGWRINQQSTFLLIDCETVSRMIEYAFSRTAQETMDFFT